MTFLIASKRVRHFILASMASALCCLSARSVSLAEVPAQSQVAGASGGSDCLMLAEAVVSDIEMMTNLTDSRGDLGRVAFADVRTRPASSSVGLKPQRMTLEQETEGARLEAVLFAFRFLRSLKNEPIQTAVDCRTEWVPKLILKAEELCRSTVQFVAQPTIQFVRPDFRDELMRELSVQQSKYFCSTAR